MGGVDTVLEKVPSEHVEQRNFVSWFRRAYPDVLIFAIPNGGHRSRIVAGKMKLEGVVRGIPDLFIPEWGTWIEMKRKKGGALSPEQRGVIGYLEKCGYTVLVTRGCESAIDSIESLRRS